MATHKVKITVQNGQITANPDRFHASKTDLVEWQSDRGDDFEVNFANRTPFGFSRKSSGGGKIPPQAFQPGVTAGSYIYNVEMAQAAADPEIIID